MEPFVFPFNRTPRPSTGGLHFKKRKWFSNTLAVAPRCARRVTGGSLRSSSIKKIALRMKEYLHKNDGKGHKKTSPSPSPLSIRVLTIHRRTITNNVNNGEMAEAR